MKQFGPQATYQRTVRLWGFSGPCFDVQNLVNRCEQAGVVALTAQAGCGDRASATPLGNTGGTVVTGAAR